MQVLRRVVVLLVLGGAWWVASRWWRSASDPPDVPVPATPWPPIAVPVAGTITAGGPAAGDSPAGGDDADPGGEVVDLAEAGGLPLVEVLADGDDGAAPGGAGLALLPRPDEGRSWVAPVDGTCPEGFPVKAKMRSRLYHLPGMLAYTRTGPDRCYPTAAAAESDGFTRARR